MTEPNPYSSPQAPVLPADAAPAEPAEMNWKRVFLFTLFILVATAAATMPFGLVTGYLAAKRQPIPDWVYAGPSLAEPLAMLVVFVWLTMRQRVMPWQHCIAVAMISGLICIPINVLYFGISIGTWLVSNVFVVGALVIAVPIGNWLRK